MARRTLFLVILVVLALACATPQALALGVLWSQPVDGAAQLTTAAGGPIVVWAAAEGGGTTALVATQYARGGAVAAGPVTVASGLTGLESWYAAGDGGDGLTVVWKSAGVVAARRVELGGAAIYGPATVCTDAAVAAARGAGATASLSGVVADGDGGVYVWCTVAPSSAAGDSLLNHVSAAGAPAAPGPGLAVPRGTVKALDVDEQGHAFVLLGPPGRNGIAVQRYAASLTADWAAPVGPYNPLLPVSAAAQRPLGLVATSHAVVAWREGTKVKAQRYSPAGSRLWLTPAAVALTGAATLSEDGAGGLYLVGTTAAGFAVRHVLYSGVEGPASPAVPPASGFGQPRVDAVTANRAGDLTVAYSDAALPPLAAAGFAQTTCLGAWRTPSLAAAPASFAGAAHDGAGGAYLLGRGAGATLLRLAEAGPALTFRPRAALVRYGRGVTVGGYLTTSDGEPAGGVDVAAVMVGATGVAFPATKTDAHGYYQQTLAPRANAAWTAITAGDGLRSDEVVVRVAPRVTLALSHTRVGARLTEILSGSVAPNHKGKRVLVQRSTSTGWRTVASGRLDARSHYRIGWVVAYRSATYKLRVVLPAHADHARGTSVTATLRVSVKKG